MKGSAGLSVIIDGQGLAAIGHVSRDGVYLNGCEYVELRGLQIRGAERAGIIVNTSQHIAIRACRISGCRRWGIQTCLSGDVTVESCEISGSVERHGIYFSTTDRPTVRKCDIHHHAGCGIHLNGDKAEGGDGMITGAVIVGNRIYENGRKGGAAINMDGVRAQHRSQPTGSSTTMRGECPLCDRWGACRDGQSDCRQCGAISAGPGPVAVKLRGGRAGGNLQVPAMSGVWCGPVFEMEWKRLKRTDQRPQWIFAYGRRDVISLGNERLTLEEWRRRSGQDGRRRCEQDDRARTIHGEELRRTLQIAGRQVLSTDDAATSAKDS